MLPRGYTRDDILHKVGVVSVSHPSREGVGPDHVAFDESARARPRVIGARD